MENNHQHAVLLVNLYERIPRLRIIENHKVPPEYEKLTSGGINAFYDWLRTANGRIIGVRYSPSSEDAERAVKDIPSRPYVKVLANGTLEIYFTTENEFAANKSGDQAFGGSDVYATKKGERVISFDLYSLTSDEMTCLRELATAL